MTQPAASDKSADILRQIAETFKQMGVTRSHGQSAAPAKPERNTENGQARFRSLSEEQGHGTRGVRHQTTRFAAAENGRSNAAPQSGQAASQPSQQTKWQDRVNASRPQANTANDNQPGKWQARENAVKANRQGNGQQPKQNAAQQQKQHERGGNGR